MNRATLFIGGAQDGKWLEVDGSLDIVHIESRYEHVLLDLLFEPKKETYYRFQIPAGSILYTVFAISHMEMDEVIAWLLAGYNKTAHTL